jgi:hypothetical protein
MDLDEISALQNIFCYSDLTKNDEFAIMNLFVHNLPESDEVIAIITILRKLKKSPHNSDEMNQRIQKHILKIFENLLYILAP